MKDYRKQIRKRRRELGLTQKEVEELLGMGIGSYYFPLQQTTNAGGDFMAKITSAMAAKHLKKLNDQRISLLSIHLFWQSGGIIYKPKECVCIKQ